MISLFYTPEESSIKKEIDYIPPINATIFLNSKCYKVDDIVFDVDNNIVRIFVI